MQRGCKSSIPHVFLDPFWQKCPELAVVIAWFPELVWSWDSQPNFSLLLWNTHMRMGGSSSCSSASDADQMHWWRADAEITVQSFKWQVEWINFSLSLSCQIVTVCTDIARCISNTLSITVKVSLLLFPSTHFLQQALNWHHKHWCTLCKPSPRQLLLYLCWIALNLMLLLAFLLFPAVPVTVSS